MWSALGRMVCAPQGMVWSTVGRMVRAAVELERLVWSTLGLGLPALGLAVCLLRAGLFLWLASVVRHVVVSLL